MPAQLQILSVSDPNRVQLVSALTVGYTRVLWRGSGVEAGLGGSVTKTFLPDELRPAYGGEPWASKIFLQVGGMRMRNL